MSVRFEPLPGETCWPHVNAWTWEHWAHWMRQGGASDEKIAQFRMDRWNYGLAVKRKGRGGKFETVWLYVPTPKQVEAHKCPARNLLYGGAAGGAKSHYLRWDFYKRCFRVPGYQALLLRRSFPELERTHLRAATYEAETLGTKVVDTEIRFPATSSLIECGHCQDEKALARYLSAEYDIIGIDEAATFPQDWVMEILSRARSTKKGVTALGRLTSNPGGAHTLYLIDRFINRTVDAETDPHYQPDQWAYIPARLYDNPYLMDPDGTFATYEARLGALAPERRRQLLEGDWDAITGQFFPEFSRERIVADLQVPDWVSWERWIDWGYNAPGVCYWVACLPDNRLYVRHEYKFTQTIAAEVAQNIKRMTAELKRALYGHSNEKLRIRKTVADPSMWSHTGHSGESLAETFARNGVSCMKGDNERVIGWQRLRHWLSKAPDGVPWMLVHPSCGYALRSIPSLISDKHQPEDVDTEGEDHAADAFRYGVMSRPAPSKRFTPGGYPKGTAGAMLAEIQRGQVGRRLGAENVLGAA